MLTFSSSVRVGVSIGTSRTSCPCLSSSAASALSRRQLPQYIPAAPAVIDRILIARFLILGFWILDSFGLSAADRHILQNRKSKISTPLQQHSSEIARTGARCGRRPRDIACREAHVLPHRARGSAA